MMKAMKKGSEGGHHRQQLMEATVRDMIGEKRRLVEVPYTASLAHTMNALVANQVVAVPVAAPPGHWIGAGGSMIMESDKQTGAVRKHYIGMVTILDILSHIAEEDATEEEVLDLDKRMSVPVSSVIGHSLEGLSLWTINPNTSKGIHRALVPLESHMENVSGVELAESSSSYRMLTQMDVLRFLKSHGSEVKNLISRSVSEVGAMVEDVFAVTRCTKVIDAIKCMRTAFLNALPIVEPSYSPQENHKKLLDGRGRKLIGTFSATDIRGCPLALLQSWLHMDVVEVTEQASKGSLNITGDLVQASRVLVTCHTNSSLVEVMDKAVDAHVHRVWVVDQQGLLVGIVSLTDILRALRALLISAS